MTLTGTFQGVPISVVAIGMGFSVSTNWFEKSQRKLMITELKARRLFRPRVQSSGTGGDDHCQAGLCECSICLREERLPALIVFVCTVRIAVQFGTDWLTRRPLRLLWSDSQLRLLLQRWHTAGSDYALSHHQSTSMRQTSPRRFSRLAAEDATSR